MSVSALSLCVKSRPGSIGIVTDEFESFCEGNGIPDDTIHGLLIAIDEAVTNIVMHAHQGLDDADIDIRFDLDDRRLRIEMIDRGPEYAPDAAALTERPALDLEGGRLGGFGLYLMQQMVDRLSFEHDDLTGRNRLVMEKDMAETPGR